MSLLKRLTGEGIWVMLSRLVISGSAVAIVAMLSHLMSPTELGQYMLLISLVTGAGVFAMYGMDNTAVREISRYVYRRNEKCPRSLIYIFYAFCTAAIGVIAVAVFLFTKLLDQSFFKGPVLDQFLFPFLFWLGFLVLTRLAAECFRGMGKIFYASIFGEALGALFLVLAVAVVLWLKLTLTLSVLIWMIVLAYCLSTFIGSGLLFTECGKTSLKNQTERAKEIFSSGTLIMLIAMVGFFISQADLWFLAMYFNPENVAIYGIVLRVIALVSIPLLITNLSLRPYIPAMMELGEQASLEKLLRAVSSLLLIPSILVLSIFVVYGGEMLAWGFGPDYAVGQIALQILTLAKIIQIATGSCGTLLIMTGHQKEMLKISLVNGALLFFLLMALVPPFGIVGCAVATSVAAISQNIIMLLVAKKRTGIWTHAGSIIDTIREWQ